MTPDEQPQPVAYIPTKTLRWLQSGHMEIATVRSGDTFGEPATALYTHPPTSAASQPDAVRVEVDDKMIRRLARHLPFGCAGTEQMRKGLEDALGIKND